MLRVFYLVVGDLAFGSGIEGVSLILLTFQRGKRNRARSSETGEREITCGKTKKDKDLENVR